MTNSSRRHTCVSMVFCLYLRGQNKKAAVAQLVRAPACHAGGCEFKSRPQRTNRTPVEVLGFCVEENLAKSFQISYNPLYTFAALAQLVERIHGKDEVVGSIPTGGSRLHAASERYGQRSSVGRAIPS